MFIKDPIIAFQYYSSFSLFFFQRISYLIKLFGWLQFDSLLLDNFGLEAKQGKKYHEERIYFSIIQKVGSWDRYQFYLFFVLYGICLLRSCLVAMLPYLFQQIDYKCHQMEGDMCTDFVCSLPSSERSHFLPANHYHSLSDDLTMDFRCEYYRTLGLISIAGSVSVIFGKFLFSFFTENFGRKNSLVLASTIMLVGLSLTYLSSYFHSITISICGVMLACLGSENAFQCIYCIATEVVAQQKRVAYFDWLSTSCGLGGIMNAIVFHFITNWKYTCFLVFIIPLAMLVLTAVIFIQKTPIDLLRTDSEDQILVTLKNMAEFNHHRFDMTFNEIKDLKKQYSDLIVNSHAKPFTPIDLFRYISLRKSLVPLILLNFITAYLFLSAPLLMDNSSTTIANPNSALQEKASIIDGCASIISVFLAFFMYGALSNKIVRLLLGIIIIQLQIYFIYTSDQIDEDINLLIYFCYVTLVAGAFMYINLLNSQAFPTQIRATGVIFVSLFQDIGDIIQPAVTYFYEISDTHFIYSLILASIVGTIILYNMEDERHPPSQIIQQILKESEEKTQY